MKSLSLLLPLALLCALAVSGCTALVVGGAATGVSVAHDRRTTATVLEDQTIELKAMDIRMSDNEINGHSLISPTSYDMTLLLTGQAETAAIRDRYANLVRQIPNVKRVVNEVTVGPSASLAERSNDAYLTSKVKIALFEIKLPDFDPTRVKVVTEQSVVYLMGLVTREEAAAVVEKVRRISGVSKVVKVFEYVTLQR